MDEQIKVLIIDDTPGNLALLYELLETHRCKILVAQDGRKGIELARAQQPDVILLDIMMPGQDGFKTCSILQSDGDTRDIPVIFLSALSDMESKLKGFRSGAVDYVTRPLRQEEVLARIQAHVELKRSRERILELERRNTVLAMAVTASHEITQPLTSLKGNLELLSMAFESSENKEAMEYIGKCKKAAMDMEHLLEKYRAASGVVVSDYGGGRSILQFPEVP
jgi:two-component system, sensor histidine kinase and response regulator